MSTISATDIIAETTAIKPPDAEPQGGCYFEVIVSGDYIEHWDSNVMWMTSFDVSEADEASITDIYGNGHRHTGKLPSWQVWTFGTHIEEVPTGTFSYDKVHKNATAKYYGVLECAGYN